MGVSEGVPPDALVKDQFSGLNLPRMGYIQRTGTVWQIISTCFVIWHSIGTSASKHISLKC